MRFDIAVPLCCRSAFEERALLFSSRRRQADEIAEPRVRKTIHAAQDGPREWVGNKGDGGKSQSGRGRTGIARTISPRVASPPRRSAAGRFLPMRVAVSP